MDNQDDDDKPHHRIPPADAPGLSHGKEAGVLFWGVRVGGPAPVSVLPVAIPIGPLQQYTIFRIDSIHLADTK